MTTLPPPENFDDHTLTEYVEALLLVEDENHLSLADLASQFPSGQRPSNAQLGLIRSEVRRRSFLLGSIYSYRADDAGVYRLSNAALGIYEFLVFLSLEYAPYRRANEFNHVNRIFDLLVREFLIARLSPTGKAVRFGTPVQDDRPEAIEDAIPWLAGQMGLATLSDDLLFDDNDCGVDVVGWQPFVSGRAGFPVWLVQCTVQMGYESKSLQIPVEYWKQVISIGPSPQTGLAVPFTVRDGDDRWLKVSLNVTSLLDRIRLCEVLDGIDLTQYQEFDEMKTFNSSELERLRAALDAVEEDSGEAEGKRRKKLPRVPKPRRQRDSDSRDSMRR